MNPLESNKPLAVSQRPPSLLDSPLMRPVSLASIPGGASDPAGGDGGSTPSLGALAQGLRRRWLLASSLSLLAGIGVVTLLFLVLPVRYTVQAAVQIHSKEERPLLNQNGVGEDPDFN